MSDNKKEMVNHPSHYQGNKFEVIDIIEDFNLDFHLGNVIKYVLRCGKKDDDIQELKKARWYLDKRMEFLYKQRSDETNEVDSGEWSAAPEDVIFQNGL